MTLAKTPTTAALAAMFTQSTGAHMLDSGGAYGRSWERNQAAAAEFGDAEEYFLSRPEVSFSTYGGELDYLTVDGFLWLAKNTEFDPELQAQFEEFAADSENSWLADMEEFVNNLPGATDIRVVNTYNYETPLNETFQWVEWEDEYGDTKVLLSYHGGCDVRGGYTKPTALTCLEDYMGDFRYELWCTNWDRQTTLDGEEVLVCGLSAQGYSSGDLEWYDHTTGSTVEVDSNHLKADDEGNVLCPRCSSPLSGGLPDC